MSLGSLIGAGVGGASAGMASMVPTIATGTTFSALPEGIGMFGAFPGVSALETTAPSLSSIMGGVQSGMTQYGSMADQLLGTGQAPPLPGMPSAPPKKQLTPTTPMSSYYVSSLLSQLPPELRQQYSALFGG